MSALERVRPDITVEETKALSENLNLQLLVEEQGPLDVLSCAGRLRRADLIGKEAAQRIKPSMEQQ